MVTALAQLSTHLHPEQHHGGGGSFRRRSRSRSRSPSVQHARPVTGQTSHSPTRARGRSPTPIGRSTSPQKPDFAETVTDIVDYVKFETSKKGRARGMG